jgi:hypothetical protein
VILCKYLLLCPTHPTGGSEWVSFRDFKDSGPLTTYFDNDVEKPIARFFSGRTHLLEQASKSLEGYPPDLELSYDVSVGFDLLPRVPVLLLFNDRDEEFSATASVLFEKRADQYLDAECLAMSGSYLFAMLKKASRHA